MVPYIYDELTAQIPISLLFKEVCIYLNQNW